MRVSLLVGEREVSLGWDTLERVIDVLPDDASMAEILSALARSEISLVRAAVAKKEAISDATVTLLASDSDPEVIASVVEWQTRRIPEELLAKITQKHWNGINRQIALHIENFDQADPIKIGRLLAQSADPSVRGALASNESAPKILVKELLNDSDAEVRRLAGSTLTRR